MASVGVKMAKIPDLIERKHGTSRGENGEIPDLIERKHGISRGENGENPRPDREEAWH